MRKLFPPVAVLALALAATPAPAQEGGSGQTAKQGDKAAQGADAELHQGMTAMEHKMMSMKPTGNPDYDFTMMMIPHHQGAIDMARVELKYGKDPELRKLAQDIIKAQEEEISTMKTWQSKHQ